MDDWQASALGNLRKRHEDKVRQQAGRIQDYVGYLLALLDSGDMASCACYARDIASDAQEIVSRLAALEAIGETAGILEAKEG